MTNSMRNFGRWAAIAGLLVLLAVSASAVFAADDADFDGVKDNVDNCPTVANRDQKNTYGGPQGDACESESATRIYQGEVVVFRNGNDNVSVYSAAGVKLDEIWSGNLLGATVGSAVKTDLGGVSVRRTSATIYTGTWIKANGGTVTFLFNYSARPGLTGTTSTDSTNGSDETDETDDTDSSEGD